MLESRLQHFSSANVAVADVAGDGLSDSRYRGHLSPTRPSFHQGKVWSISWCTVRNFISSSVCQLY